jgi:hypothetical protein
MPNQHIFPFGQPLRPVVQADRTPKKLFILGVYASAVHARRPERPLGRLAGTAPPLGTARGRGDSPIGAFVSGDNTMPGETPLHKQVLSSLAGLDIPGYTVDVEQTGVRIDLPNERFAAGERPAGQRQRTLCYTDAIVHQQGRPRVLIEVVHTSPAKPNGIAGLVVNFRKALVDYPIGPYLRHIPPPTVLFPSADGAAKEWCTYRDHALALVAGEVQFLLSAGPRSVTRLRGVRELLPH